ncbi:MAG: bifunctional oligoribonuclease and phosphatase NrnA [Clostridia bacterium]|nr:bifunctional oligoribonuclease and phosphatase NrnA [Clostridia bacterium]
MTMTDFDKIVEALAAADDITIASHVIPDGDCLGSMLALAISLEELGKKVVVVNADSVPDMLKFLPSQEKITLPEKVTNVSPLLVMVDCTDLERAGETVSQWKPKVKQIINIDHHVSNSYFGHLNLVDSKAAATAEIIYSLLLKIPATITPEVATCLYTGLATDTGSFQYENCTAKTLRLAANLMEQGADIPLIREYLWERKPLSSIKLLTHALPTLTLSHDGKVAWMSVTQEVLDKIGSLLQHTEGLVNYPRSIEGVEVGLLFRELPDNQIKVSFRSKKNVDVDKVAAQFGGGGHKRAAGCTIKGDLETVIKKVVSSVGEVL